MSQNQDQEPKSWRDIVINAIEEARATAVEIGQEIATGEKHHEERMEYTDIFESKEQEIDQQEIDTDYER